jgi:Holliday junction DNA helicase RuvA
MIASVRGTVLFIGLDHLVVEANGIGYHIFAPRTVLAQIGEVGSETRLYTHLHVREDILALYGFSSSDQRYLFDTLLGVSGIGPKVALSLLSSAPSDDLRRIIAAGDVAQLSRVPGIGKKTAERLVLELKGKIDIKGLPAGNAATPAQINANADLIDMLVSLGFSASEANAAIAALPADAPTEFEERLRLALRYFGGA